MTHCISRSKLVWLMLLVGCDRKVPTDAALRPAPRDKVFDAAGEILLAILDPSADRKDNGEGAKIAKPLIRIVCAHDPTINVAAAAAVMAAPLRDAYPPYSRNAFMGGAACGRLFDASQEYVGETLRQYRLQHPDFRQPLPPPPVLPAPYRRLKPTKSQLP